jgi:hypothetical protein
MTDPAARGKGKKMSAVATSGPPAVSGSPAASGSAAAQRKGASMVGLRLADMNQHFCTAMFGVVLGDCHPCSFPEKVLSAETRNI